MGETASIEGFALTLTDAAVTEALALLAGEDGTTNLGLRVGVEPGGCAGLRYELHFEEIPDPASYGTDALLHFGSLKVMVDRRCHGELNGAKIDFVRTLTKREFVIDNPNATGKCACGDSYH